MKPEGKVAMDKPFNEVRTFLLDRLLSELEQDSPKFVALLRAGSAENAYNYAEAEKELSTPVEPWRTLLDSLLDIELGVDFFSLSMDQIARSQDGRELHFYIQTRSIYMRALFERMEHFLKRLQRSGLASSAEKLLGAISDAKNHGGLSKARHTAAHGRFVGASRPIADTQTEYYWEPYAVVRLPESHLSGWHESQQNNSAALKSHAAKESNEVMGFVIQTMSQISELLEDR